MNNTILKLKLGFKLQLSAQPTSICLFILSMKTQQKLVKGTTSAFSLQPWAVSCEPWARSHDLGTNKKQKHKRQNDSLINKCVRPPGLVALCVNRSRREIFINKYWNPSQSLSLSSVTRTERVAGIALLC